MEDSTLYGTFPIVLPGSTPPPPQRQTGISNAANLQGPLYLILFSPTHVVRFRGQPSRALSLSLSFLLLLSPSLSPFFLVSRPVTRIMCWPSLFPLSQLLLGPLLSLSSFHSVCLRLCVSMSISLFPSYRPSYCLSIYLSAFLRLSASVWVFACLPMVVCVCVFVALRLCVCPPNRLFPCLSLSHSCSLSSSLSPNRERVIYHHQYTNRLFGICINKFSR